MNLKIKRNDLEVITCAKTNLRYGFGFNSRKEVGKIEAYKVPASFLSTEENAKYSFCDENDELIGEKDSWMVVKWLNPLQGTLDLVFESL